MFYIKRYRLAELVWIFDTVTQPRRLEMGDIFVRILEFSRFWTFSFRTFTVTWSSSTKLFLFKFLIFKINSRFYVFGMVPQLLKFTDKNLKNYLVN